MGNHYHLIIETPAGNLGRARHYINSSYTTDTNIKRKRSRHLFQGTFKAILIDKDSYRVTAVSPGGRSWGRVARV